ncbi:hypothetical protein [Desulfurivibrio alkaliphilus]|uniref:Uncharacterized protein n=1 Tax=Desulfurivibrio alkaliphilus (strain DSM 19089 / UNIQEM U267 / AHT2) TaxID=589865 RepID=D6Z5G4_DESAT|nr:hypothetical protein [Desulfurivibrio alkaliphilus]ADH86701.1 conserved hypothetical protein [Desulfurivibrio alkaliphilus AHT 2]
MDRVVDSIYTHELDRYTSLDPFLNKFLQIKGLNGEELRELQEKQDAYLLRLVEKRGCDESFMEWLFKVVAQFSIERKHRFVAQFVRRNKKLEAFKRLSLEPRERSSSGSWVPVLQERVEYWESMLPIVNTVELLGHKQYIERRIQALRSAIEQEKKNDFIGD